MPTPTHDLRTRKTPIGELRPHPRNARNGDTDVIGASLAANGQYRPIVASRGGVILAGNHTYAAAVELGWTHLSAVHLDIDPDSDEAVRIMLADNRTADLGEYDPRDLLDLLLTLSDDLTGTGYSDEDLTDLSLLLSAPDLDDLHEEVGDVTSDDELVTIRVHVPPASALLWQAALDATGLDGMEAVVLVIRAGYDALVDASTP